MRTQDTQITSVKIFRSRFAGQEQEDSGVFEVSNSVAEITFFESLDSPYVSGSIVLVDSSAVSSTVNFQGQERVQISWKVGNKSRSRDFYIFGISSSIKDEYSSTIVLQIIEPLGYISNFYRLQGSRNGEISDMIRSVYAGPLSTETDPERFEKTTTACRVLESNRTPLGFCMWLASKSTSTLGEPMFLYSTLGNGPKFASLGSLGGGLDQKFYFTDTPPSDISDSYLWSLSTIQGLTEKDSSNIISLARTGSLKSTLFTIDPFSRKADLVNFHAASHFAERASESRTLGPYSVFDEHFQVNGVPLIDLSSVYFSKVTTSNVYRNSKSIHEEGNPDFHVRKLARNADLSLLKRNTLNISLSGVLFGKEDFDTTVGHSIDLVIPKDQPSFQTNSNMIDRRRSGKYLIFAAAHRFLVTGEYTLSLEIVRDGIEDNINDKLREIREKRPS